MLYLLQSQSLVSLYWPPLFLHPAPALPTRARADDDYEDFQEEALSLPSLFRYLRGSHGLSARRARRMKSRGTKGLQLEVQAQRTPILLVFLAIVFTRLG